MTGTLKLLAVFPHPDDETLGLGSTLARYSADGFETYLVCATRGERGWYDSEGANPGLEGVAQIREAELRCAAEHLGLREVSFLDYIDGDVDRADPEEIIGRIVSHIRRIQPHVIVTFPQPTFTETPSHTPTVHPSTVELEGAEVPEGFSLIKFADLYHPLAFTFDAQGRMYVTSQDDNVYILPDEDKDGRPDSHLTFATGFYFPLGVTFRDPTGDIYVSHQGKITVLRDTDNDNRADLQEIFTTAKNFLKSSAAMPLSPFLARG